MNYALTVQVGCDRSLGSLALRMRFISKNPEGNARIIRAITIFFLLYTAFDLAVPQICTEDLARHTPDAESVSSVAGGNAGEQLISSIEPSTDSQKKQIPDQPSNDEDCFCCCAHILPCSYFAGDSSGEVREIFFSAVPDYLPTPPAKFTYHPPRLA
jgi:hypothetical protein